MSTIAPYIVHGKTEDFPDLYIHMFSYFPSYLKEPNIYTPCKLKHPRTTWFYCKQEVGPENSREALQHELFHDSIILKCENMQKIHENNMEIQKYNQIRTYPWPKIKLFSQTFFSVLL